MQAVTELEKRFKAALASLAPNNVASGDDAEKAAFSSQVTGLEAAQLQKNQKIEALETQINDLQTHLKATETNGDVDTDTDARISTLEAEIATQKTQMEALQFQREEDLKEVNIILEKLSPLVEGK